MSSQNVNSVLKPRKSWANRGKLVTLKCWTGLCAFVLDWWSGSLLSARLASVPTHSLVFFWLTVHSWESEGILILALTELTLPTCVPAVPKKCVLLLWVWLSFTSVCFSLVGLSHRLIFFISEYLNSFQLSSPLYFLYSSSIFSVIRKLGLLFQHSFGDISGRYCRFGSNNANVKVIWIFLFLSI